MPLHIKADKSDISDKVILVGDQGRAEFLSHLLRDPKLVSSNRGLLVYTGECKCSIWRSHAAKSVTIATSGMGQPSMAIVAEELHMLGAKKIVRFGTCGAISRNVKIGDYIIATHASFTDGGIHSQYPEGLLPVASHGLSSKIWESMKSMNASGIKVHAGKIFTSDAFYAEDDAFRQAREDEGNIAADMETAILFKIARMRMFSAACVAVAVNEVQDKSAFLSADALAERIRAGAEAILSALTK
jgi:5'-methylthioadenosine phosphorylase